MDLRLITTAPFLEGHRVLTYHGVVRGLTVRSRSAVGSWAASFQVFFGGRISIFTELCEQAREESFHMMVQEAQARSANAIIAMRYDANEVLSGVTEVLCYGTAVTVMPCDQSSVNQGQGGVSQEQFLAASGESDAGASPLSEPPNA